MSGSLSTMALALMMTVRAYLGNCFLWTAMGCLAQFQLPLSGVHHGDCRDREPMSLTGETR